MSLQYDPLNWLLLSVGLYILAANAFWWLQRRAAAGSRLQVVVRLLTFVAPALLFLYYVAPPYILLLLGYVDPRQAGLIGLDWPRAIQVAFVLGVSALVLLLLGRWHYRRSIPPDTSAAPISAISLLWQLWRAAFQQAHWLFYRALLTSIGAYQAVFAALALTMLEWVLNPAWRHGWSSADRTEERALDLALGLTTAAVFVYTGNFWACLIVHLGLAAVLSLRRGADANVVPSAVNAMPVQESNLPEPGGYTD